MIETKQLGNSDLQITRIGFGAWAIGGAGWQFAWGVQDDRDSIAAIRAAVDAGVNWIDTAAIYGVGHSEEVVGRAVAELSRKPYIFTKCERLARADGSIYGCLKAESIRKECEASLRRLKVDVIDLYQMHWPQPDEDIEEGWTEMARLKEQGKVRWIGVSNFNVEQMKRLQKIAPITSLQPPYSLLAREVEDGILPYAEENNLGVIVYSPMKNGLLSGAMTRERALNLPADDWRSRNPHFQEPLLSRNLELAELLRRIGQRDGRTAGEVAIAWTLNNPAVSGAIVGLRKAQQIKGVIGALEFRLNNEGVAEIEAALRKEGATA
jgi:aryl-alcohol dehydrogenase-like predicted oxidoreductase